MAKDTPDSGTLKMTFDPATVEHLGIQMYSTLPPVLAELVANSSDANASTVHIHLEDSGTTKQITVSDNGLGMTFEEINDKFLRIGRNRRTEEESETNEMGRKVIGKKGIGKLAFFGIAQEIVVTSQKAGLENSFSMNWEAIKKSGHEYNPDVLVGNREIDKEAHGTTIVLRDLRRKSDFSAEEVAIALSRIFIVDSAFQISVQRNQETPITVENERKYDGLEREVEWRVPQDIKLDTTYELHGKLNGHLIATKKPIPPKTNMRGVTLFSRKKLVNAPEYFSESTSSHFFSYLTGWIEVDFIDDLSEDVIATDRQSLRWGNTEMEELRDYLRQVMNWLEQDWRKQRENLRKKALADTTGINTEQWFSKLPDDVRSKVESVVKAIVKESELPDEVGVLAVKTFHDIVPEYPKFHWRYLHPQVQEASRQYYEDKNYYTAFLEAAKRYINASRTKAELAPGVDERNAMEQIYAHRDPILSVTENYKKPNGTDFQPDTIQNIKEGHRMYSVGVVVGGRHVVSHEEIAELRETGLFREEDCLDALSMLSHLFWRLENSVKVK